jgi:beta-ketoacyl ACP synthase
LSTGIGLPDVVVTGVAMSTALATDAESTWKKLVDGQSGIRRLTDSFIEQYDFRFASAALLKEFDSEPTRVALRPL